MEFLQKVKQQTGCRGKLVLFYHNEEKLTPYQMLVESTKKAGLEVYLKKTGSTRGTQYEHVIQIGDETIVTGFADNNKNAREILGPKALQLMQESCFTVIVKNQLEGKNVCRNDISNVYIKQNVERIGTERIDSKKRKDRQDQSQIRVLDSYIKDKKLETLEFKIFKYLENYCNNSALNNLIFSNEFSNDERKIIHETAQKLKLKSKSFGKCSQWQLVICKKVSSWDLVEYLILNGDTINYQLQKPTKTAECESNENSHNQSDFIENISKKIKLDPEYQQLTYQRCIPPPIQNISDFNEAQCNIQHYSLYQHYNLQQKYSLVSKNRLHLALSDVYLLDKVKNQNGCRGKFIIFQNSLGNLSSYQMLVESAQKSQMELQLKRTGQSKEALHEYAIEIEGERIISDYVENNKQARDLLGNKALVLLQQTCFTIVVKTHLKGRNVKRIDIEETCIYEQNYNNIYKDNSKGIQMMLHMGWNGKGLGKANNERQKPIEMTENLRRFGLSFGKDRSLDIFQSKILKYLENYVINPCTYNLVFCNEFSVDERKIIHEVSLKLKLKSKSFGKYGEWQLVVSKKMSPWELVENLLASGDSSANYQLKRPTNMMMYNYFY